LLVGDLALAGESSPRLGGSEYLAHFGGTDEFPTLPDNPRALVEAIAAVANDESTLATHDVSHGGLAVSLAEMVTHNAGLTVDLSDVESDQQNEYLFSEQPGRVLVETTDPETVRKRFEGVAPVAHLGTTTDTGDLSVSIGETNIHAEADTIVEYRSTIENALE